MCDANAIFFKSHIFLVLFDEFLIILDILKHISSLGETQESSAYSMSVKSESPIRGNDFCSNDENTFNHQVEMHPIVDLN